MTVRLSRLQFRVRNRRLGSRRHALFSGIDSSVFAQSILSCVVVLLLVEMMFPQPHHGMPFDRYISRNAMPMPAALRDDALKVMLARDGAIYFGGTKVASEDLPEQLRQRLHSSAQRKVFLVVDQRARFRNVSIVLDDVQCAGIGDIAFLTELQAARR
jgi:biopolymer transport protein ExbD